MDKPLKFEELKIGMKVIDKDKNIGVITEIEDVHNVHVEFDGGGAGIYCLFENCIEDNIPHYDPLFKK